jgi:hypothetical protein
MQLLYFSIKSGASIIHDQRGSFAIRGSQPGPPVTFGQKARPGSGGIGRIQETMRARLAPFTLPTLVETSLTSPKQNRF